MKRIISIILILMMFFSFSACNVKNGDSDEIASVIREQETAKNSNEQTEETDEVVALQNETVNEPVSDDKMEGSADDGVTNTPAVEVEKPSENEDEKDSGAQNFVEEQTPEYSSGTMMHPIFQANFPYPYFKEETEFKCDDDYIIKQLYSKGYDKDVYQAYDAKTGKYHHVNDDSPLIYNKEVDFDGLPVIPTAEKTVLKPIEKGDLGCIGNNAWGFHVFRGTKSGNSLQKVWFTSTTIGYPLLYIAHTPITVTESLYGDFKKSDTLMFAENAAVVEYEGKEHIMCADGYPPIKKDTEYIFIVKKSEGSFVDFEAYNPAFPVRFCVFEITDEVKAASSAEELTGLTDAEKEVYQRFYYDTLG